MTCKSCGSDQQKKFRAEIAIHWQGRENLEKPIVWVFPELLICPDCGVAEFSVSETELRTLTRKAAAAG
jgi:hypothetical protein